jgi:hypothetical protein
LKAVVDYWKSEIYKSASQNQYSRSPHSGWIFYWIELEIYKY